MSPATPPTAFAGIPLLFADRVVLAETGATGSAFGSLLPLLLIVAAFYFFAIRPQQRRARAQRELVSSLGLGDRVVTVGGIHGTIRSLDEDTVQIEISPGTTITIVRSAVGRKVVDADTAVDDDES